MIVREPVAGDAQALARIYNHYVRESIVTFEEVEIDGDEMRQRMRDVAAAGLPWRVAEEGGRVVGFAFAGKWKARAAYRHSVETTVYVDPAGLGQGIGRRLYDDLFARLGQLDVNAVIGGIALPNDRSVALHEAMGMVKVAHFKSVGFKFGRWIDVAYWQLLLK